MLSTLKQPHFYLVVFAEKSCQWTDKAVFDIPTGICHGIIGHCAYSIHSREDTMLTLNRKCALMLVQLRRPITGYF